MRAITTTTATELILQQWGDQTRHPPHCCFPVSSFLSPHSASPLLCMNRGGLSISALLPACLPTYLTGCWDYLNSTSSSSSSSPSNAERIHTYIHITLHTAWIPMIPTPSPLHSHNTPCMRRAMHATACTVLHYCTVSAIVLQHYSGDTTNWNIILELPLTLGLYTILISVLYRPSLWWWLCNYWLFITVLSLHFSLITLLLTRF